jgi:hypothetical protein
MHFMESGLRPIELLASIMQANASRSGSHIFFC